MPPKPMRAKHAVALMLRRNATTGEVALACSYCDTEEVEAVKTNVRLSKMPWGTEGAELARTIRTLHFMVELNPQC